MRGRGGGRWSRRRRWEKEVERDGDEGDGCGVEGMMEEVEYGEEEEEEEGKYSK